MKYYGYVRVSTETQAEKGGGLTVQADAIRDYAKAKGITIEKVFTDAGISGTKESRPELDALLLETIQDGDVIIVHNTSRLWRSIFAQTTVMKAVMDANAHIVSIDEPSFDVYKLMTDPDNFMISSMMGMLDQWERMTIARKLARGRAAKARSGHKPAGVCPTGYRYSDDKKHVEIDPEEASIVRFIFSEAQKGCSLNRIAALLNEKGVSTRRGNQWSAGAIQAILHNRFYVGELTHHSMTVKAAHEPIISKVQFGKVQAQLEKRRKN